MGAEASLSPRARTETIETAMSDSLFRQQALQRAGAPDELDRLVRIGGAAGWALIGGLGLALAAMLVWAVLATAPMMVRGPGLLLPAGGVPSTAAEPAVRVIAYVPAARAARIAPGQEVRVVPGDGRSGGAGALAGTVTAVAPLPASRASIEAELGAPALAEAWLAAGPVQAVTIALTADTAEGAGSAAIRAGLVAEAQIVTERRSVLALLLPGLDRWLGDPSRP